jgi:hypothetical protein
MKTQKNLKMISMTTRAQTKTLEMGMTMTMKKMVKMSKIWKECSNQMKKNLSNSRSQKMTK